MKDRLIELLQIAPNLDTLYHEDYEWERAAKYLLANGVIVPPVKVGQTVYHIRRTPESHGGSYIVEAKVVRIHIRLYADEVYFEPVLRYTQKNGMPEEETSIFGRWFFLTREEAEKALAERSNNERSDKN